MNKFIKRLLFLLFISFICSLGINDYGYAKTINVSASSSLFENDDELSFNANNYAFTLIRGLNENNLTNIKSVNLKDSSGNSITAYIKDDSDAPICTRNFTTSDSIHKYSIYNDVESTIYFDTDNNQYKISKLYVDEKEVYYYEFYDDTEKIENDYTERNYVVAGNEFLFRCNSLTKTNYDFVGWYINKGENTKKVSYQSDAKYYITTSYFTDYLDDNNILKFYADYEIQLLVHYDYNLPEKTTSTLTNEDVYKSKKSSLSTNYKYITGYTLKGYNCTELNQLLEVNKSYSSSLFSEYNEIHLTAQWEQRVLTLDPNGGTFVDESFVPKYNYEDVCDQDTIDLPGYTKINKDGYFLIGWKQDPNIGDTTYSQTNASPDAINVSSGVVASNYKLIAQWGPARVVYITDGDTTTTYYYRSNGFSDTSKNYLPTPDPKDGYVFAGYTGYCLSSDGSEQTDITVTDLSKTVMVICNDNKNSFEIHLTANWVIPKIFYNGHGGKVVTIDGDSELVDYEYSSTSENRAIDNPFVNKGYKFLYWCEDSAGTGTHYTANDVISYTPSMTKPTLTLYAFWEEMPYYFTIDGDGGSTSDGATTKKIDASSRIEAITFDTEFIKSGYITLGYSTSQGKTSLDESDIRLNGFSTWVQYIDEANATNNEVKLYPIYSPKYLKVNAGDGKFGDNTSEKEIKLIELNSADFIATLDGFSLAGYTETLAAASARISSINYDNVNSIDKSYYNYTDGKYLLTLYALWNDERSYVLLKSDKVNFSDGAASKLFLVSSISEFTTNMFAHDEGYRFLGWNIAYNENPNNESYDFASLSASNLASISTTSEDSQGRKYFDLFAVWKNLRRNDALGAGLVHSLNANTAYKFEGGRFKVNSDPYVYEDVEFYVDGGNYTFTKQ